MYSSETGSIPWEEIFDRANKGKPKDDAIGVRGGSGVKLFYDVGKYSLEGKTRVKIHVYDASDNDMQLRATAGVTTGDFRLSLRTRGYNGIPEQRHPDFRAKEFVGDALRFFDERWGITPTHFIGMWLERDVPSDNYQQFYHSLDVTNNAMQAAQQTWSGRTVGAYGYVNVRDIYISHEKITAKFWKPR